MAMKKVVKPTSKKPKGWTDNPLGEIQKLYNVWQPNYTDPQSLAQFKETSKQIGSIGLQASDLYTTGGLGLSFAQNVIQPAALIASAETRNAAASKGMTQFTKDVAITAASAGAGYAAEKVVSKVAAKVVESGIPARIANKVKGETVVVHGTGRPIVGNTINPMAGSAYSPDKPASFSWNTNFAKGEKDGQNFIHGNVQEYSNRPYYDAALKKEVPGQGNIVIGKTKMKDAIKDLTSNSVIASTKPIKITKVIQDDPGLTQWANRDKFVQELKRAGVKTGPGPVKNMLDKVEQQKLLRRSRIQSKNSPV